MMNALHPVLNLIVLRSPNMDRLAQFYRQLGIEFTKHAHGSGPEHYASDLGGLVFEIYPLGASQIATTSTRIGFAVASVDEMFAKLEGFGAEVVSSPKDSPWGRRAVIRDLDGHTVELLESRSELPLPPEQES